MEEENMILRALGRKRVRTTLAKQQDDPLPESGTSPQQSPTNPLDTSTSSFADHVAGNVSPTRAPKIMKREQKRYSNSLFRSGNLRDNEHNVVSKAGSDTSTISHKLRTKFNFLRPRSPEASSSGIPTPTKNVLTDRKSPSASQTAFLDPSSNTSTKIRASHKSQPDALGPVSLILKEAIREIGEEVKEARADDSTVLLHSPTVDQQRNEDPFVCIDVLWPIA